MDESFYNWLIGEFKKQASGRLRPELLAALKSTRSALQSSLAGRLPEFGSVYTSNTGKSPDFISASTEAAEIVARMLRDFAHDLAALPASVADIDAMA